MQEQGLFGWTCYSNIILYFFVIEYQISVYVNTSLK